MNGNDKPGDGKVRLDCGLEILLDRITQGKTYASLLCGIPDEEINARMINHSMNAARDLLYGGLPIHMIEPKITMHTKTYSNSSPIEYPKLPRIACAATFWCGYEKEPTNDFSMLKVVWFQDEWAFPIASEIVRQIQAISWLDLAEGGAY